MEKILVTGGAGYIGSILVPELLKKGYEVTVIDNFMYRPSSLLSCCASKKFNVIKGNVTDKKLMKEEISKHDILIPLAAIVGAPACSKNPEIASAINYDSVEFMVSQLSNDQKIFFPVTNSGYGIGEPGKDCTEESLLRPISQYGKEKVKAEKVLLETGNAVTFRLATVFGMSPRMRIDLLVNDFVYRAVYDRSIVLFESHFKRNYIHVRDVTGVFLFGLDNYELMRGETYNVGLSDANISKLELCKRIKNIVPDFHILESDVGKDPDKRDYIVSNAKVEGIGWSPQYSLDDGIRELVKGYNMIRSGGQFDNIP
jgi:nucleoside-diphosphate-sugar epimerase